MSSQNEQHSDPGSEQWLFRTEGKIMSSPTVVDGTVYVGSWDYNLYAVDAASGTEEWSFETGGVVRSSPTVVDETAYVGSHDNNLYAVDAVSGIVEWSFETGDSVRSSPIVVDGIVYVGSDDGNLYAVDAVSGTEEWTFETGDSVNSSPTVVDETVYVGSDDGSLYAVDADSGTEEWNFRTGHNVYSSPTVVDGTVYVGSDDNSLYAVDAARGTEEWSFQTWNFVMSSPTVADGTVYVGDSSCNLFAVDATGGTKEWSFRTGSHVYSSPTVVDGTVYVGSWDCNLYAVDAASGTEEWSFETENKIMSSPTVVDGMVYVGSDDHNLYAITASAAPETQETQPSKKGSRSNWPSVPEESSQIHPEKIKAGTAQIPSPEAVRSPKQRNLSHEDFQTVEDIGHGGQAVIKKARLSDSKTPPTVVALREPKASGTVNREVVEEFLNRAEIWQKIDARERNKQRWDGYEHIVGVIDIGELPVPWIAMEYMDGGDLEELLEEHSDGLPVNQALWTGECICKGLEIADKLGMSHLDVKPENILLKQIEGWPWPKLADWGLARTLAKETGTMDAMSPKYAAPEQFDTSTFGDPDQLTDIYQTGALLHALLTGAPPVTGSPTEVVGAVLSGESIPTPSERRPELPPVVDTAVGLALENHKTDRYDSIADFRKALNAIRTGERLPREVARCVEE